MKLFKDLEAYLKTNTKITDENISTFLKWLQDKGFSAHTQRQKLSYLIAYANDRARRKM